MIEAAMYVALGFCSAGLIGLAILPAFYRRAARLTEEALRAVNPASYAEVRAAQDQERARYAVELTRVETRLEGERSKAAKFHLEASRLRSEIDTLKQGHQDQIAELQAKLTAQDSEEHAVGMLSAEIKALKAKLADSEKALADSWASSPKASPEAEAASQSSSKDDSDWLPATDTMALATITGLEAEVATLKGRLAKYEPTVASEVEASLQDNAKSRLAELEAQLVDTESKYVAAQAEVTRLSLMLEAADVPDVAPDEKLRDELKRLTAEISSQEEALTDKERSLQRLTGQNQKLRADLAASSDLRELREEFRTLAQRLSATETIAVKRVAKRAPAKRKVVQGQLPADGAAKTATPPVLEATVSAPRPKAVRRRKKPAAAAPNVENAAPAKSTDIASAAEALVSRIVASSRNNAENTSKGAANTTTTPSSDTQPPRETDAARKPKSSKQKKKDVA